MRAPTFIQILFFYLWALEFIGFHLTVTAVPLPFPIPTTPFNEQTQAQLLASSKSALATRRPFGRMPQSDPHLDLVIQKGLDTQTRRKGRPSKRVAPVAASANAGSRAAGSSLSWSKGHRRPHPSAQSKSNSTLTWKKMGGGATKYIKKLNPAGIAKKVVSAAARYAGKFVGRGR